MAFDDEIKIQIALLLDTSLPSSICNIWVCCSTQNADESLVDCPSTVTVKFSASIAKREL